MIVLETNSKYHRSNQKNTQEIFEAGQKLQNLGVAMEKILKHWNCENHIP